MSNNENKKVNDVETKEKNRVVEVKAKDLKKEKRKNKKDQINLQNL